MENEDRYSIAAKKKLVDVDNLLIDGLYKKYDFDFFKDYSVFTEINPRIIFEEKQKILDLKKHREAEKERIRKLQDIEYQREQAEIERQRLLKEQQEEQERLEREKIRLENIEKFKRRNFWDSAAIFLFILLLIFFMLLISPK